jgi:membrane fusion protein (multidrug efflux system)
VCWIDVHISLNEKGENFMAKNGVMRLLQILAVLFILNATMGYAEQPPAKVVVSKVVLQKIARDHAFIGTLYYERISHISSEVSGLVATIGVR